MMDARAGAGGPSGPGEARSSHAGDSRASAGAGHGGAGASEARGHGGEAHADTRLYLGVAAVLAVLTAMEVMVFYVDALRPALVPVLLVLMIAKFALVAMFFMHLRYDSPVLSAVFGWGIVIAVGIIVALMAIFGRFAGGAS